MKNDFGEKISYPKEETNYNIYAELKAQELPLYLYGAGNLASNIIQKLVKEDILIDGILIDKEAENDDLDKKRKTGIPVYYFSDFVMNRSELCNVLIAFAKGYRKKSSIEKIPCFTNVYILENPFEHHKRIESEYIKSNLNMLRKAYKLLEDDLSKESFCAFINARINGNAEWVADVSKTDIDEFNNDVMFTRKDEVFLDVGAYNGGSIKRFLASNGFNAKKIIGIEPDESNYRILSDYMKSIQEYDYELHQIGCWFEKARLPFNKDDKCSRLDSKSQYYIDVDKIDNICGLDERITLYNMGISVAEYEILRGSSELIKKWHPKLIVFMGSARDELWQIPQYIHELSSEYKIYLRFLTAMPSRFFLYAV